MWTHFEDFKTLILLANFNRSITAQCANMIMTTSLLKCIFHRILRHVGALVLVAFDCGYVANRNQDSWNEERLFFFQI